MIGSMSSVARRKRCSVSWIGDLMASIRDVSDFSTPSTSYGDAQSAGFQPDRSNFNSRVNSIPPTSEVSLVLKLYRLLYRVSVIVRNPCR